MVVNTVKDSLSGTIMIGLWNLENLLLVNYLHFEQALEDLHCDISCSCQAWLQTFHLGIDSCREAWRSWWDIGQWFANEHAPASQQQMPKKSHH